MDVQKQFWNKNRVLLFTPQKISSIVYWIVLQGISYSLHFIAS